MSSILSILLIITVGLVFSSNGQCTNNADCLSDECCLLGPMRYSTPTCIPYQKKGDQCRVNAEFVTTNLTYPNNSHLEVKNVSYILCPCVKETSCNKETGICD
ncbi:astakine [Harpegnathos saltator]|uniref:Astakine n=1 Tax=Harpegnathos saltator TaxID=610380 RepID=E2BE56_HARSA|nr:astakine [Harpegnathos saltator]EFN86043.1 Astakine [Harpegnathos saltator]